MCAGAARALARCTAGRTPGKHSLQSSVPRPDTCAFHGGRASHYVCVAPLAWFAAGLRTCPVSSSAPYCTPFLGGVPCGRPGDTPPPRRLRGVGGAPTVACKEQFLGRSRRTMVESLIERTSCRPACIPQQRPRDGDPNKKEEEATELRAMKLGLCNLRVSLGDQSDTEPESFNLAEPEHEGHAKRRRSRPTCQMADGPAVSHLRGPRADAASQTLHMNLPPHAWLLKARQAWQCCTQFSRCDRAGFTPRPLEFGGVLPLMLARWCEVPLNTSRGLRPGARRCCWSRGTSVPAFRIACANIGHGGGNSDEAMAYTAHLCQGEIVAAGCLCRRSTHPLCGRS